MEQAAAGGGWRKGPWTPQEDKLLFDYITQNGEGRWSSVFKCTGLKRSGKSCRLRWVNYLRPGLKKGQLTPLEEGIIIELHALWGNKWSTIARYLPGRTDNEIKNYWRTHFKIRKPSHHLKQVEKSRINVNHKLQQQQQQSQTDSRDQSPKMHNSKGDEEMSSFPSIDNQQFLPSVYQETASDFIPFDCYLWGGLWNLDGDDDLPNICAKMPVADENQANNIANYYHPFEGDAVDYVQSAEIFL